MLAAARRSGRLGLLDLQSRFWPGLSELRRLVADGYLGTVENVELRAFYPTFTRPEKVLASLWCADAEAGASTLRVHGLHSADVLRWIFGEITDVRGTTATRRPSWPTPDGPLAATSRDSMALTGRVAGGALLSMHTSWVAWHGSGWRLAAYGSEGTLVASADGHTGHFPVRLVGARAEEPQLRDLEPTVGRDEVPELAPDAATLPFARLVRHLAAALAADDPAAAAELPTFADGVGLLRLADAVDGGHPTAAPHEPAGSPPEPARTDRGRDQGGASDE
jgi:predicted dehydrogenase